MRAPSALVALFAATLLATACASSNHEMQDTAHVVSPVLISSQKPELRFSSPPRNGRRLDIRVDVQIDTAGQPDLETLHVTGLGSGENREVVATWIRNARFRPAQQDGRPVPGVFQTRIEVKVVARRVG